LRSPRRTWESPKEDSFENHRDAIDPLNRAGYAKKNGGIEMRRIAFSLLVALGVLTALCVKAGAATAGNKFSGSYGYAMQAAQFGPFVFVDVGVLTLHGDGSVTGTDFTEFAFAPFPRDAENALFSFNGTWTLDSDRINGTLDLDFGIFHFVVDDNGEVLRLSRTDGTYESGRAIRQDLKFIAKLASGKIKPEFNNSNVCSSIDPQFPFPDFPSGIPVSIIETQVQNKSGFLEKTITSGNFFSNSTTSTTPPTVIFHPDGTSEVTSADGSKAFGVVTSPGRDNFAAGINPGFVGFCVGHPRDHKD
jgi:hypothetical protein